MMMMTIIIITMGHECIWATVGGQWEGEGEKERILRGWKDGHTLNIYI
jgi:hypothetical protein